MTPRSGVFDVRFGESTPQLRCLEVRIVTESCRTARIHEYATLDFTAPNHFSRRILESRDSHIAGGVGKKSSLFQSCFPHLCDELRVVRRIQSLALEIDAA